MTDSPFIRDVPASRAHQAWRDAREAAGCPARIPATRVPVAHAAGLVRAVIPVEHAGTIAPESARQSRRDRPVEESPSSAEQGAG